MHSKVLLSCTPITEFHERQEGWDNQTQTSFGSWQLCWFHLFCLIVLFSYVLLMFEFCYFCLMAFPSSNLVGNFERLCYAHWISLQCEISGLTIEKQLVIFLNIVDFGAHFAKIPVRPPKFVHAAAFMGLKWSDTKAFKFERFPEQFGPEFDLVQFPLILTRIWGTRSSHFNLLIPVFPPSNLFFTAKATQNGRQLKEKNTCQWISPVWYPIMQYP